MSASFIPSHPLPSGAILPSLGGHFTYRVMGPCCRLFDRELLPWPCCRLQWRGKEPSWRRIGRRLTPDLAVQRSPSYAVEILEPGHVGEIIILTVYSDRLTPQQRNWWYSKGKNQDRAGITPPPAVLPDPGAARSLSILTADQHSAGANVSARTETSLSKKQDVPGIVQCVLPL